MEALCSLLHAAATGFPSHLALPCQLGDTACTHTRLTTDIWANLVLMVPGRWWWLCGGPAQWTM